MNARKIWDIPGGIHPAENKSQSLQTSIQSAPIADELVFPLSQHIGAPAEACVEIGERVLKGQVIARAKGFVSVPIHASTSGTITAIEQRPIAHPSGLSGQCIVLKSDGKDEAIAFTGTPDYQNIDKQDLINHIRESGIAGMGGAGFPSAVKLATDKVIDQLIINATECEPYITADDILIRERAQEIVEGVQILQHIISPQTETLIGIEDNKPEAIQALTQACQGLDIEVVVFPTKYPSGGEKQLISILTGKEVPKGGLPADIGIVCQNIGTTHAIRNAVIDGRPLISRITTMTGDTLNPQNYEVPLGTPVKHLLDISGHKPERNQRLVMGGPMMGFALASDLVPVIKTTNCILAPTEKELPSNPISQACIRCGICAEACPASLLPQQLYWYARSQNHEQLENHNLFDCIECGACSFSCPSHIPLVQYYRNAKAAIREENADKIKAEKAKIRFEQRQERLEREEAEKEAKRKARKEAALKGKQSNAQDVIAQAVARTQAKKSNQPQVDPVQAAIERAQAKRNAPKEELSPAQKLEKDIASLEKRIANTNKKLTALDDSDADKIDMLRSSIEKQQAKLDGLKKQYAALPKTEQTDESKNEIASDPAQAAIERAQAKRNAPKVELPRSEQLDKDIATLEKRIDNANKKMAALAETDSDKIDALRSSLDKQQQKLDALKQERCELNADSNAEPEDSQQSTEAAEAEANDPAQAAIERAQKARAQESNMSAEEKQAAALEKIEKRIQAQQKKLASLKESNPDAAELIEQSLEKLFDKKKQLEENT